MLPPIGKRGDSPTTWIRLEYLILDGECQFRAFVAPTTDIDLRKKVVARLIRDKKEFGFATFFKKAGPYNNWTRLATETLLTWGEDEPPDENKVAETVAVHIGSLEKRLADVPEALRPIINEWMSQPSSDSTASVAT